MTTRRVAAFYYDKKRGKVRPIMERRGGSSTFSRGGHKYVVKVKPSKPALDQAKDLERAKTEIQEAKEDAKDAQGIAWNQTQITKTSPSQERSQGSKRGNR